MNDKQKVPFGCYYIQRDYIEYLQKHGDPHVPNANYEDSDRTTKFYCGPVFTKFGVDYYVPVSGQTREMRLSKLETYGVNIKDKNGTAIGCLDFRFAIPCQDPELLTPYAPSGHGAKQAQYCFICQKAICKEALATYNNIISNDYPWLTANAIDQDAVIDSMWQYDDEKFARKKQQLEIISAAPMPEYENAERMLEK